MKAVCVAGAGVFLGSYIVKEALEQGYRVSAVLREAPVSAKALHLMQLPHADHLNFCTADMHVGHDFDEALEGVDCVFIACLVPTYVGVSGKKATDMQDEQGYRDIIMPTVDGCLNIMQSALKNGVNNAVICSSTSSVNPPEAVVIKNEIDHWSDEAVQC